MQDTLVRVAITATTAATVYFSGSLLDNALRCDNRPVVRKIRRGGHAMTPIQYVDTRSALSHFAFAAT